MRPATANQLDHRTLTLVDLVQSPVGQVLEHQHRPVVSVEGCNSKCLVGMKADDGADVAGRRDVVGAVRRALNDAASDRFLLILIQRLLMIMIISSMLRCVDSNYPEAVPESTVRESHLLFTTHCISFSISFAR